MLGYLYKEDPTRESQREYKYYSSKHAKLATRSDYSSVGWGAIGTLVSLPTGRLVSPKNRKTDLLFVS